MTTTTTPSRRLGAHLRPRGRLLVGLCGALAAATALPLLGPQVVSEFVDSVLDGRSDNALAALAGTYLAVAVATHGVRVFTAILASRAAWDGTNRLRQVIADHALGLDLDFHGRRTPGEMIERVDGDVAALGEFFVAFVLEVLAGGLLLVGVLVVVSFEDPRLGGALAAYIVAVALVVARSHRRSVAPLVANREAHAQHMGGIEEHLAGLEDLRANGAGAYAVRRFDQSAADVHRTSRLAERAEATLLGTVYIASTVGTAALLGLGIVLQQRGALSIGATVALFQYTQLVRQPLERMADQLQYLQGALAGAGRLKELLDERPSLPVPTGGGIALPAGPLAVHLDGVDFAYADDGEAVLAGVDLAVAPGRTLGLVGRSGGGKTTLARLLCRLYDPTGGAVRLGDVDLREVGRADLRRRVAVVTQDVVLFDASLRDNLTLFGAASGVATDGDLTRLLTRLGLGAWLAGLPDGLDSHVGPGGAGLSAGEAQLLAFARAFLVDPGLVILDEASSRLDPATEVLLESAVGRLLAGRTAVVIAHRLSSLDRVDDIAVVEGGRVVEHGARVDLLARPDSHYARLLARALAT